MKENENVSKKFYDGTENKKCSICGSTELLDFYQIKHATSPTGIYAKYVGYVCSKCIETKIGPLFHNFKQVWDTRDFEMMEYKEHLLEKPENA